MSNISVKKKGTNWDKVKSYFDTVRYEFNTKNSCKLCGASFELPCINNHPLKDHLINEHSIDKQELRY
jgi:hypothetical protein